MADREFVLIGENTLEVAFVMEVNREMNEHNKLYGRFLPDQHNIGSITGLQDALDANSSAIVAEKERAEGVEGSLSNLATEDKTNLVSAINEVDSHADTNATNLSNHIDDKSNPHEVTKAQVGLGNCDNTADIDKPISTATQTALDNITNGTTSIAYDNTTSGLSATTLQGAIDEIDSDLDNVEDLIPSTASSSNQLADKSYVDTADSGLQEQINMLNARGRFLALWNCATGLAQSNPPESPYIYKAGDYFIIGTVGTTNYKPTGSSYVTGQASTVVETESVDVNDVYYYDGANWILQINTQKEVSFASVAGSPYDNTNLSNALNAKQNTIDSTHKLDSDLVDDSGQTNKFITASEKSQISTNASDITALQSGKADKSTTYTKTEVDTIVTGKANVGLDNLNANGQMIVDSVNGYISNCILEIPQNLKVTLENNVLTLKSGSTVVNTGKTYSTFTTTADTTLSVVVGNLDYNPYYIMCYGNMNLQLIRKASVYSGSSLPESLPSNNDLFYLTTDKTIYQWKENTQTFNKSSYRYPLGVVHKVSTTEAAFVKDSDGNDMIFNGKGFIGHHAFFYPNPNVGLIAEGISDSGLLSSSKVSRKSLQTLELLGGDIDVYKRCTYSIPNGNVALFRYNEVDDVSELNPNSSYYSYVKNNNAIMHISNNIPTTVNRLPEVYFQVDNNNFVTDWTPRQPVRLATTEMLDKVQDQVDTNTTAISGKQDTLVSGTNIKTINGTTVLGSGNFALADQSLSNLDSTGQMVIDTQNGTISNCILEIPQNIKLEISGEVVTLKAGSVITLAQSIYATITTSVDKTYNTLSGINGTFFVFIDNSGQYLSLFNVNTTVSGETDSLVGTTYHTWFDTTNKVIYRYTSDASTPSSTLAYPLCVVIKDSNGVRFAKDSKGRDLIFNGCGYIGHHAFVYPNVKVLNPDGFNDDGTLKSNIGTVSSLSLFNIPINYNSNYAIYLKKDGSLSRQGYGQDVEYYDDLITTPYLMQYVKSRNLKYMYYDGSFHESSNTWILYLPSRNGAIDLSLSRFYQPYEGARNLLTDELQADVTTLTGYDSTQTQTLKNINGVLTWVTD